MNNTNTMGNIHEAASDGLNTFKQRLNANGEHETNVNEYNGFDIKKGVKIYLAIPYSRIEEESFEVANHVASILMMKGCLVFSPISMCHTISRKHKLPGDFTFWKELDTEFVTWCDVVMVVNLSPTTIRGLKLIDSSQGVQYELNLAKQLKKHIIYFEYEGAK